MRKPIGEQNVAMPTHIPTLRIISWISSNLKEFTHGGRDALPTADMATNELPLPIQIKNPNVGSSSLFYH